MQTTSFPYKNVLTLDPLQSLQSHCMQTMVLPYWCVDFKHFNVSPLLLLIIPSYLSSSLLILFSAKSDFFTWPFLNQVLILIIIFSSVKCLLDSFPHVLGHFWSYGIVPICHSIGSSVSKHLCDFIFSTWNFLFKILVSEFTFIVFQYRIYLPHIFFT